MKVFSATLATETNTFSPIPTGLDSFRQGNWFPAGTHPPEMTLFSGPLFAARQRAQSHGLSLAEGLVAAAQPSGRVTRSAYETLRDQVLADLDAAGPVSIVLLGLHGAMAADGYDDCEGDLLSRVRQRVGPEVVIGATLDPHCHLSERMVDSANLLICWKHYPHTDGLERALELVDLCVALRNGDIQLQPVLVDTGLITVVHTTREPGASLVRRLHEIEALPGIASASIAHGFPWGDVPAMGTQVLVYANTRAPGAIERATVACQALAQQIRDLREALSPPYQSIDTCYDQALAAKQGPYVIADGPDNPGGGAGGDSTFHLRRLVERQISPAALGPLYDPGAVGMAFNAGVGARIRLRIGGKISAMSGDPIDLDVTVKSLIRNHTQSGLVEGERVDCGDSALLDANGLTIVLISTRVQAMGTDLFTAHGCDLSAQRIIVVKSSQHFHAKFGPIAAKVLYAEAPGSVTQDLQQLAYKKVTRPRWPLREG